MTTTDRPGRYMTIAPRYQSTVHPVADPGAGLPSIAFSGLAGTGKSALAAVLVAQYGYVGHTWAAPIRDLAALAYGGPIVKDRRYEVTLPSSEGAEVEVEWITGREVLQRLGTDAIRNHLDQDFWLRIGLAEMERRVTEAAWADIDAGRPEQGVRFVNDDTRFPNEARALAKLGFVVVGLRTDPSTRAARLGLDFSHDGWRDGHISERADRLPVHLTVDTSGSVADSLSSLFAQLETK